MKKPIKVALSLIVFLGLSLILFEFGVRISDSFNAEKRRINLEESVFLQVPILEFRLYANIRFKDNPDIHRFFLTEFNTNNHGFRGGDFNIKKKPGVIRIACIGGSTTFGHGSSSDAYTYPEFLEKRLKDAYPKKSIEVLNFSIPGYFSIQELIIFNTQVLEFDPDIIIILSGWNDLSRLFHMDSSEFEKMFVGDSRLVKMLDIQADRYFSKSHWAVLRQIGRWRYKIDKRKRRINEGYVQVKSNISRREEMAESVSNYLENPYFYERLFRIFQNSIEGIVLTAKKRGISVVIVNLPLVIKPDSDDKLYDLCEKRFPEMVSLSKGDFYSEQWLRAIQRYNDIIGNISKDTGCIFVDINNELPKDESVIDLFCDLVHFNDKGNDLLAIQILKKLRIDN